MFNWSTGVHYYNSNEFYILMALKQTITNLLITLLVISLILVGAFCISRAMTINMVDRDAYCKQIFGAEYYWLSGEVQGNIRHCQMIILDQDGGNYTKKDKYFTTQQYDLSCHAPSFLQFNEWSVKCVAIA